MVNKGEMWVLDWSCITQLQSEITTDSKAYNCVTHAVTFYSYQRRSQPTTQVWLGGWVAGWLPKCGVKDPHFALARHRVSSSSVVRESKQITEGGGFKSHVGLGFFRVLSGFHHQLHFIYVSFSHLLSWIIINTIIVILNVENARLFETTLKKA